ncbi:MAG: tRNA (guanosine(37)-N1)-methyltransferase TrmD [Gammaproteobacteria bacterium RIFCSPHIGHO2_12_FULL_37_14]|nr:MAG: tRNA (guanosine(37)-N1)-methyltransferase TrmD [Gammaproteobacteria bacterium RIFCSPHIGHO2_12_FULL_37_14]
MWFGVISLFPEVLGVLNSGVTGRAKQNQLLQINCWNPRDFATDKHRSVDDKPYGGGPGMLMMAEPLHAAICDAKKAAPENTSVIYLSPQGKRFDQEIASQFAAKGSLILVAGRYEGIDERIIQQDIDEEISIGDYILTGGELAAMVIIDTISRLIPGTVGDHHSVSLDSLTSGLLKYPQYTRPEHFLDDKVPEILLSGHHQQIEHWRLKQSLGKTWLKRPDLLAKKQLSQEEISALNEFIEEFLQKNSRKMP